jgi:hypothetical protein
MLASKIKHPNDKKLLNLSNFQVQLVHKEVNLGRYLQIDRAVHDSRPIVGLSRHVPIPGQPIR